MCCNCYPTLIFLPSNGRKSPITRGTPGVARYVDNNIDYNLLMELVIRMSCASCKMFEDAKSNRGSVQIRYLKIK